MQTHAVAFGIQDDGEVAPTLLDERLGVQDFAARRGYTSQGGREVRARLEIDGGAATPDAQPWCSTSGMKMQET
jgi:hypothetical protein